MAIKLLTVLLVSILALTFVSSAIIRVAKVEDDEMITHEFLMNKIEDVMEEFETESESFSITESMSEMPSESMMEMETQSETGTVPPSVSETASETPSETATGSETSSQTPTHTPSNLATTTPTTTPTNTPTTTPTNSPTNSPTTTPTNTPTTTPTNSPTQTATRPPSTSNTPTTVPVGGAQIAAVMSIATDKSAADFTPAATAALADAIADLVHFIVSITRISDVQKGNGVKVDYVMYIPAGVDVAQALNSIAAIPASDFTASMNTKLQQVDSSFVITGATVPTLEVVPVAGQSNTYTYSSTSTKTVAPSVSTSLSATLSIGASTTPTTTKTSTTSPTKTPTKTATKSIAASATPTKPMEVPTSGSYTGTVLFSIVSVFLFAVFSN